MSVPGPTLGPFSAWIEGADVQECCGIEECDNPSALNSAAVIASMVLYELSGRQFPGLSDPVTVRPCRDGCGCFGAPGGWRWSYSDGLGPSGWAWRSDECGDSCGCGSLSQVRLEGYPVREILEVKVDGAVIDPSGYRLDGWRFLVRMDDPGPPARVRRWPGCQVLSLDDDQPGTWSVTYRWGADPPPLGQDAAAQFACQLYKACTGGKCDMPNRVTRIVRQGVTMEKVQPLAEQIRGGQTGLLQLDAFLTAYPNRRRSAVWSPELRYPKHVGA